jgi:hypothetical protein
MREERRALQLWPEQDGFHELRPGERPRMVEATVEILESMFLKVTCCDFGNDSTSERMGSAPIASDNRHYARW